MLHEVVVVEGENVHREKYAYYLVVDDEEIGGYERDPLHDPPEHRQLATLTFAGLRLGELLSFRWRDVDLAAGWLKVGEAKTDAGTRRAKIRGALRDELAALKARHGGDPDALVFPTSTGKPISPSNVRNRVLANAVKRANERLAEAGEVPLPVGLTPHSLRRTFASLLYAIGEPAPVVMQELGHTHPGLALRIYAAAMRRDDDENERLRALIEGGLVTSDHSEAPANAERVPHLEAASRS